MVQPAMQGPRLHGSKSLPVGFCTGFRHLGVSPFHQRTRVPVVFAQRGLHLVAQEVQPRCECLHCLLRVLPQECSSRPQPEKADSRPLKTRRQMRPDQMRRTRESRAMFLAR